MDSILHVKASDLLLAADRIRAALADAGKDERLISKWKHGAIVWRLETDKMGVHRIAPINVEARTEIDCYLSANPRVGESWLFEHTVKVKGKDVPSTRLPAAGTLRKRSRLPIRLTTTTAYWLQSISNRGTA